MRIAIAMSGGVDSTATALILKKNGFDVVGLHMILYAGSERTWVRAQQAAQEIGVEIHPVNLSQEFSEVVVDHFVAEYVRGRTPSPCPLCNRMIKMNFLLEKARSMECEKIATGHYARIERMAGGPALFRGSDRTKDQSYFLSMLDRDLLNSVLFPLGRMRKSEVNALLRTDNISIADTEESQELCFIVEGDYRSFLLTKGIDPRPGPIVNLRGEVLGTHPGIIGYTVGQRRGLGIYGTEPLYVVALESSTNTVVVGTRRETLSSAVQVSHFSSLRSELISEGERFQVQIRSTAQAVPCTITNVSDDRLQLIFDVPQSGVAPGQAAVLFSDDMVVGGGWIDGGNHLMDCPVLSPSGEGHD